MYRSEKFNPSLFGKLFHLGGKLSGSNRWLKLAEALPWEKLDAAYGRYFSAGYGRPAKDSRLICGLLAVKQLKGLSNEETANILKLSLAAVKSRLHRGRLFLRDEFERVENPSGASRISKR